MIRRPVTAGPRLSPPVPARGAQLGAFVALLALLALLVGAPRPAYAETALPPPECVRLLRDARIADQEGDTEAELRALRAASERFPEELAPVHGLLLFDREHGLPEEERRRLEARLGERLTDPERPPPPAVLQWLVADPEAESAHLARVSGSIARRLLAADVGRRPDEAGGNGGGTDADETEDLLRLQTNLQVRLGRTEEAATTLARLWRRTGRLSDAWRLLDLYIDLGLRDRALELFEQSADLRRELWPTRLSLLAEAGRLDDAVALLEEKIAEAGPPAPVPAQAPGTPPVTGGAAEARTPADREGGWGSDMYPDLEGRIGAGDLSGRLRWLLESLAWSFRDAGRDAEAERHFRRAAALHPDDEQLSAVLLHLYATDEERQARAEVEAERWERTANPQVLLDEGTQRLAAGDAEGALDLLARAAPHFPGLEAPWYNLGMAASRLERWQQAANALGRATELNPERGASFFFRGLALVHLERCGEAVRALERALELDPARTLAHYYLASCYRTLGQPATAERHQRLYRASQG